MASETYQTVARVGEVPEGQGRLIEAGGRLIALFLDGGVASGLYAHELGRDDAPGHGGYGPITAAVD